MMRLSTAAGWYQVCPVPLSGGEGSLVNGPVLLHRGPPSARVPWQDAQFCAKSFLPRMTLAESRSRETDCCAVCSFTTRWLPGVVVRGTVGLGLSLQAVTARLAIRKRCVVFIGEPLVNGPIDGVVVAPAPNRSRTKAELSLVTVQARALGGLVGNDSASRGLSIGARDPGWAEEHAVMRQLSGFAAAQWAQDVPHCPQSIPCSRPELCLTA